MPMLIIILISFAVAIYYKIESNKINKKLKSFEKEQQLYKSK